MQLLFTPIGFCIFKLQLFIALVTLNNVEIQVYFYSTSISVENEHIADDAVEYYFRMYVGFIVEMLICISISFQWPLTRERAFSLSLLSG